MPTTHRHSTNPLGRRLDALEARLELNGGDALDIRQATDDFWAWLQRPEHATILRELKDVTHTYTDAKHVVAERLGVRWDDPQVAVDPTVTATYAAFIAHTVQVMREAGMAPLANYVEATEAVRASGTR